jgi:hypothetical protein
MKAKIIKAMKTSMLVSGFAALCLLITFAETPDRLNAKKENKPVVRNISSIPANSVIPVPAVKVSSGKTGKAQVKTNVTLVEDFSYLKFDVTKYIDKDEMNSDDIQELMVEDFSYLKFDVNKYFAQSSMNSDSLKGIQ